MKTLLTFLAVFFMSLGLSAQDATIKVTDVHGLVTYQASKLAAPQRVWPGGKLPVSGWINVPEGATIHLLDGSTLHRLKNKGTYDLEKFHNANGKQSMSFSTRFWNFLNEGLKSADTDRDLERYHQGYMAVSGGVKGFGPGDQGIHLLAPLPGNVGAQRVVFRWARDTHRGVYQFILIDADSGKGVFRSEVPDTMISVDLAQLGLAQDKTYRWQVKAVGQDLQAELSFRWTGPADETVQRSLDLLKDYPLADEKEARWMKATVLEMEEYNYEAQTEFENMLLDYPDDGYVRQLYALFLTRQDDVERARAFWPDMPTDGF
ncbi:MAG: hypothetical protein R2787_10435 [Saprospiraceae bacterium]